MASSSVSSHPINRPPPSKKRGSYNCGRCGQPKKGHVCNLPPPSPSSAPPRTDHRSRRALSFDEDPLVISQVKQPAPILLTCDEEDDEEIDEGEEMVGMGSAGNVPVSCLMEILRRVPPKGIVAAGRVCRGWRESVKRMWRLSEELRIKVSPQSPIGFVGSLLENCAGLVRLTLRMESDATISTLTRLAFYCSKLESLEISMANGATNRIPGDGLSRFVAEKKSLSVLKLENCANFGYLNLSSSSLTTLWLSDLRSLSKAVFNCPNLKEISLDFNKKEKDSTDLSTLMDNLGRTCPNLKNLHVSSNRLCNEAVLALASSNLRFLRMLSLVFGSRITDAAVASIVRSFSSLELLDLSGSSISDSGIGMICRAYPRTLGKLLLTLCPNITSNGLQLATAQLPYLELLDCGMSLAVSSEETGKSIPKKSSCQKLIIEHVNLKKLSLWGCSALDALYVNCPELDDLNLNSCTNLHPERLLLHCPNLKKVFASGCQDMLIGAIRNQVLNEFANGDLPCKRLADGSKRVLVPHSLAFFSNDEEKQSNKRRKREQCAVLI